MTTDMPLPLDDRWIDAIMRQCKYSFLLPLPYCEAYLSPTLVRLEGWIHHLARHAAACYLTRGQCYISWERGAEVFDGASELFCYKGREKD